VHRVPGGKGHSVFAFTHELDEWLAAPRGRSADAPFAEGNDSDGLRALTQLSAVASRRVRRVWASAALVGCFAVVAGLAVRFGWTGGVWGRRSTPAASTTTPTVSSPPSVVVRRVQQSADGASYFGTPSPDGALFSHVEGTGNVAVLDLATRQVRRVTHDASYSPRQSVRLSDGDLAG
jgi:hypothetical protein